MLVWVRRSPGRRHGNPLQYSCLENPMDRGACRATVHGVAQIQTRLKWLSMNAHALPIYHFQKPRNYPMKSIPFYYYCSVAQVHWLFVPRGLQQARLPCPSLSPEVCSNSRPLSRWCHLILVCLFYRWRNWGLGSLCNSNPRQHH